VTKQSARKRAGDGGPLGPEDWLQAARKMLIADGIDRVKVERIADRLGVTRGGFYWHFKDRQSLLDQLLRHWEKTNTDAFIATIAAAPPHLEERVLKLFIIWMEARDFDVGLEMAVRNWARRSKKVHKAVRNADARRLSFIQSLFEDEGYNQREAMVRSRIIYFTQIGYFAIEEEMTMGTRAAVSDLFYEVYTGRKLSASGAADFNARFERYRNAPAMAAAPETD
jgi:AcrR family transcriptional regulator